MKELFRKALQRLQAGESLILAAIAAGHGSAPRHEGSCMLVGASGRLAGTIGGGAVELQSERMSMELIREGASGIHAFRLHKNSAEDIGMICGGDVDVIFQFLDAGNPGTVSAVSEAAERIAKGIPGAFRLAADGSEPEVSDEAGGALSGDGMDAVYLLPLEVPDQAFLIGAGHISEALAPILKSVGFRVTVMDDRAEYVTRERFPQADELVCAPYGRLLDRLRPGPDDFAAVMTSGHVHDFEALSQLLRADLAYVGSIGSSAKIASVNSRLRQEGFSEDKIASVHAPIGTKILAVTPAEIAVSIAGEMILVRAERRKLQGKEAGHGCPMR